MTLAAELRRHKEDDQGMNLGLKGLITSIKNWLNTNPFNVMTDESQLRTAVDSPRAELLRLGFDRYCLTSQT